MLKTGLLLTVDNFATVSGSKARAMSKVSRCRLEKVENLDASEIKYSSSRLRKKFNTFEIMLTSTTAHEFYAIFFY